MFWELLRQHGWVSKTIHPGVLPWLVCRAAFWHGSCPDLLTLREEFSWHELLPASQHRCRCGQVGGILKPSFARMSWLALCGSGKDTGARTGGGGCECFLGGPQGVPGPDRTGGLSQLQPGCSLLQMLAADAPDEMGELCRSQNAGGGPMSGTEQLSCVGWLRARRAQGDLGGGGGGHELHHTHTLK